MAASDWISVTDRLPDDDLTVLAFAAGDSEPIWLAYVEPDDNDEPTWFTAEGATAAAEGEPGWGPVTHWMDLPDAPE